MNKLTDREIIEGLTQLKGWILNKGKLEKNYSFANFARAVVFVNKLVNPIEELQNYPSILLTYNRVNVTLFNHEAGAITQADFDLAAAFDELV